MRHTQDYGGLGSQMGGKLFRDDEDIILITMLIRTVFDGMFFFFFFFQLNESFNNVVYTRSRLEVVNWSRYRDVLFTIKLLTRKRQAINLLSTEARPPMLFRR